MTLEAHNSEDEYLADGSIKAIENPARGLDKLPMTGAGSQFGNTWAKLRMVRKQFDMCEYSLHDMRRGLRIIQGDIVGDLIQITERGLGPTYFSHRAIRFLAV